MLYDQIQRKGKFIESCESSTTNEMNVSDTLKKHLCLGIRWI